MFRVAIFGQYVPFFARSIFDIPNVTYLSTLRGGGRLREAAREGVLATQKQKTLSATWSYVSAPILDILCLWVSLPWYPHAQNETLDNNGCLI